MFLITAVHPPGSLSSLQADEQGGVKGRQGNRETIFETKHPQWCHVCYSRPLGDAAESGLFLKPVWRKAAKH